MKRADLLAFAKKIDSDKDLKKRLVADPKAVLTELGIEPDTLVGAAEKSSKKKAAAKSAAKETSARYRIVCIYIGIISPMWCGRASTNAEFPVR